MELGKRIKFYRERDGLSQENLAEKIYVSRQSISNWENEKSYPDIHNILQLSELFCVSLDELVKGDVDMMKKEVEKEKFNSWTRWMLAGMLLMPLSMGPAVKFLGLRGLIIPFLFAVLMFISAIQVEKIKKNNNMQTYTEILAYMENKEVDEEKLKEEKADFKKSKVFLMLISAVVTLILMGIGSVVVLF